MAIPNRMVTQKMVYLPMREKEKLLKICRFDIPNGKGYYFVFMKNKSTTQAALVVDKDVHKVKRNECSELLAGGLESVGSFVS